MNNYTYQPEEGEYVFYKNDKKLTTPDGALVTADNEHLAKKIEEALKNGESFTSPTSVLCFHYTYVNLKAEYTKEFVADDFSNCISVDRLMRDDYLMFHQDSPIKVAHANFFAKNLPEYFHESYNLQQLAAILTVHAVYESWMLSQYIISDICNPIFTGEEDDNKGLINWFMEDLEEYEIDQFGKKPSKKHLQEMRGMIETFVYYFCQSFGRYLD